MVSADGGVVYLNYNGDYVDYPPDSVNNDVSSNESRSYLPNSLPFIEYSSSNNESSNDDDSITSQAHC
jgi:hypothetical protein